MKLYFTDSLGQVRVIAEGIRDEGHALEIIMSDQSKRFVRSHGVFERTLTDGKINYTSYCNEARTKMGYTLVPSGDED